ncbi:hypothetical protein DFH06DRAFT_1323564 [Mycena polygramma]|nr:hypothetical protein DFH06DRAFT_1323564 [Mycena polygramma]
MTPAVHGSRAQRKTSTSILRHEYFSAASPHRSHPDAGTACFCSTSWSSCAWRRDELYVAKRFFEREMAYATAEAPVGYRPRRLAGTCICRDLSGRVLVKSRSMHPALPPTAPDSNTHCRRNFSAPNARYDVPKAARAPSNLISAAHGLRPQRITFVSSFRFLGLEIIFKRSTTKSTALAFVRQPFPMHSAFIFRRRQTSELHQLSSQPSKTLGHGARHAHEAFAAIIFDLIIKVSTALAFLRNTAATSLLPALVLPCQTKLKLDQLLSQRPTAHARNASHMPLAFDFSDSDEFSKDPRPSPPPWRLLGSRPPCIPRSFSAAVERPRRDRLSAWHPGLQHPDHYHMSSERLWKYEVNHLMFAMYGPNHAYSSQGPSSTINRAHFIKLYRAF